MVKTLLNNLAKRMSSENNLSDITWAMAESCPAFKKTFLRYLFPEIEAPELATIYREYPLATGGRPDFLIEVGDKRYLLENKKYDTDYHFEKYAKASLSNNILKLGIILNHKLEPHIDRCGFEVFRWNDFVSQLEKHSFDSKEDKIYVDAYIQYVKEVCCIMDLKEVKFDNDNLHSLQYFYNLVVTVIKDYKGNGIHCDFYNAPQRAFSAKHTGSYFSLQRTDTKGIALPFFGIYYGDEIPTPVIYCAFESDWCETIYERLKGREENKEVFSIETNSFDAEIDIALNNSIYQEFVGKEATLETQKRILEEFFDKVVNEVKQYL